MTRVLTSRRWQLACLISQLLGATLFVLCLRGLPVSPWWVMAAFWCSWFTGFLAAVLVEIGTQ